MHKSKFEKNISWTNFVQFWRWDHFPSQYLKKEGEGNHWCDYSKYVQFIPRKKYLNHVLLSICGNWWWLMSNRKRTVGDRTRQSGFQKSYLSCPSEFTLCFDWRTTRQQTHLVLSTKNTHIASFPSNSTQKMMEPQLWRWPHVGWLRARTHRQQRCVEEGRYGGTEFSAPLPEGIAGPSGATVPAQLGPHLS